MHCFLSLWFGFIPCHEGRCILSVNFCDHFQSIMSCFCRTPNRWHNTGWKTSICKVSTVSFTSIHITLNKLLCFFWDFQKEVRQLSSIFGACLFTKTWFLVSRWIRLTIMVRDFLSHPLTECKIGFVILIWRSKWIYSSFVSQQREKLWVSELMMISTLWM